MTPSSNGGEKRDELPILISQGEPSGIGPEIAVKAYAALNGAAAGHPLRLLGSARVFREAARICGIDSGRLDIADTGDISAEPGKPRKENATSVTGAIESGVSLCAGGKAAALVTAPINKAVLTSAGFGFPGHTEFLAHLLSVKRPVMMLVSRGVEPPLRVVPLTIHLALREVFARLDPEEITAVAEIVLKALACDFGCTHPRLAIAGLNPHAGEEGTMGREDRDILAPAVSRLRALGHAVLGPLPADTMFHEDARKSYDAALCMYHDQALIPLKTLSFWNGVNVTLGLPIVRTSPDHGTAFDIAGRGIANPSSMISAIELAAEIAGRRQG